MRGLKELICISTLLVLLVFTQNCSSSSSENKDPQQESANIESFCNNKTGLSKPLTPCTAGNPCKNVAEELGVSEITTPSDAPKCQTRTDLGHPRPFYDDSPAKSYTDSDGVNRYYCMYRPPSASATNKLPLVIFMHGGGIGSADDVYNATSLRTKAINYQLSQDSSRRGFFLIAIQGRNLHYTTTFNPRDGHHHDFYFRELNSPSKNPDIVNMDKVIDDMVSTGEVDPQQIYLAGWSNGTFFSQMYAIARHEKTTPGGHRVAAVFGYTGADPFNTFDSPEHDLNCALDPYPRSQIPILLIGRSCDIVACDEEQASSFASSGTKIEPGHIAGPWLEDLLNKVGNTNVRKITINSRGEQVSSCLHTSNCTPKLGLINHMKWPDGVLDENINNDQEPEILEFFKSHQL